MNVAQLITELRKFPQNAEVWVWADIDGQVSATDPVDHVNLDDDGDVVIYGEEV